MGETSWEVAIRAGRCHTTDLLFDCMLLLTMLMQQ